MPDGGKKPNGGAQCKEVGPTGRAALVLKCVLLIITFLPEKPLASRRNE
jgi:hypothetical protein